MNTEQFMKGDVVGMVYAQPGNDVTYLVLTDIREIDATGWDFTWGNGGFEIKNIKLSKIWKATEQELQMTIGFDGGRRILSIRQLSDEFKNRKQEPNSEEVLVS